MYCYQCGSKLGSGRYCLRCGADVSKYRRIVQLSNSYYNAGLEKAKLRDLSGAAEMLDRSLQLYKKNTDARNLLGLVYYEMGEVVEALCQWVISKNLTPDDNLADEYLGRIQHDRNTLDTYNQAIKKYNQSLAALRTGGRDLAIIQLKRVIRQHPHFIKAYELLALIYIDEEQYSRASKLLKTVLRIDKNNTLCIKYSKMIQGKLGRSIRRKPENRPVSEDVLRIDPASDSDDVVVPDYKAPAKRSHIFSAGLVGVVVGLAMYQFVISSTVAHNTSIAENARIAEYDNRLADKQMEVESLADVMAQGETEKAELQSRIDELTGENGLSAQYDALLYVVNMYMEDKTNGGGTDIFTEFAKVDETAVDSEAYATIYGAMKQYVTVDRISSYYKEAYNLYSDNYYKKAIPAFEKVLELNPEYTDAMYYLAVCYEKRKDYANALKYYQMIVNGYTDSEYYSSASKKVASLTEKIAQDGAQLGDNDNN